MEVESGGPSDAMSDGRSVASNDSTAETVATARVRKTCYLCENLHLSDAARNVPLFVSENIAKMQVDTICDLIRQTIREEDFVDLSFDDVYEHVTKHFSDKRIDACIMLQDLKKLAQASNTMSYSRDENTGAQMIDQKVCQVYLDTVKQIVAVHRTMNS